jgi:hypothetical protein
MRPFMIKTIYIFACMFLLNSCASILNQSETEIDVHTTKPSKIIFNNDTVQTNNNKATVVSVRENKPIEITALTDSLTKTVTVFPKSSTAYYLNFMSFGIAGLLVERNNPKRYGYPGSIYLNSSDSMPKYYSYSQSSKKGELYLHLSLPYINSFYLQPENELDSKVNTGFLGISMGLDYRHL